MILHKWTIILVGFLVALLEEKTRKTTEFPVPQVSPSSFSQWKEVQKCDTDYTQDAKNPQLHHLKKSIGRPFFVDQSPRFSKKANMMIDDFGPDLGISISLSSKQRWISGFWVLTRNLILAPITEAFWGGGVEVWCYVNNSTLPRLRATVR